MHAHIVTSLSALDLLLYSTLEDVFIILVFIILILSPSLVAWSERAEIKAWKKMHRRRRKAIGELQNGLQHVRFGHVRRTTPSLATSIQKYTHQYMRLFTATQCGHEANSNQVFIIRLLLFQRYPPISGLYYLVEESSYRPFLWHKAPKHWPHDEAFVSDTLMVWTMSPTVKFSATFGKNLTTVGRACGILR